MLSVSVGAIAVVRAAFLGEVFEDFGGKGGVGLALAEVVVNSGQVAVDRRRYLMEREVEGKGKFAPDGGDAAGYVGFVDSAGVPRVSGGLGDGGEKPSGWGGAVGGCDGECFVKNFKETFHGESFMVVIGNGVEGKLELFANVLEGAAKFAVGVDDNKGAEADFKEHATEKEVSESVGVW